MTGSIPPPPSKLPRLAIVWLLLMTWSGSAAPARKLAGADEARLPEPVRRPVQYFGDIHPVLAEHCVSCHGPEKQKGGLRLDSRALALEGGSAYGPAIIPGNSADSPLVLFIAHLEPEMEMPPKKEKLPEQTIATLRAWIDQGAQWPVKPDSSPDAVSTLGNRELLFKKASSHWSFQPIKKASQTSLSNGSVTIDALVAGKLRDRKLQPSPRADARTLLRRLHFDLTGLPPNNAELTAFNDAFRERPDSAIEAKVDELLASPHFGERWGRYWLDLARYADTQDFFPTQDLRYPFAWTFRDYVTAAFNSDKPYDQFIREQIAADQMNLQKDDPSLAALGFLTVGPRFLKRNDEVINDRIDAVTRGLMGLTVVCARCHDHKFDPIPTADFYALHGVFNSTEDLTTLPEIDLVGARVQPKLKEEYQAAIKKADEAVKEYTASEGKKAVADLLSKADQYFAALHQIEFKKTELTKVISDTKLMVTALKPLAEQWSAFKKSKEAASDPVLFLLASVASASGTIPQIQLIVDSGKTPDGTHDVDSSLLSALRQTPPKDTESVLKLYGNLLRDEERETSTSPKPLTNALRRDGGLLDFQPKDIESAVRMAPQGGKEYEKLNKVIADLEASHPGSPARAMAVKDRAKPVNPVIYIRGDATRKGDAVERRFLEILDPEKKPFSKEQSGRRELAERIANAENPLTARVRVNHIWRHLFGRALVKTTGDFGLQSAPPSHPELLDWMASALIQRDWSTKKLIRDILLSSTYQQSSKERPDCAAADPENTLLWRANRRRMDFESMRDAMLATSERLDRTVGGRAVNLSAEPFTGRRTLYGFVDRVNIDPLFTTFDFPSPDIVNTERTQTLVPQQALFSLNDRFIIEQARSIAALCGANTDPDLHPHRVTDRLYQSLFQRPPTSAEQNMASLFLKTTTQQHEPLQGRVWLYGFGSADPSVPREEAFHELPHYDLQSKRYQGGSAFPHPQHGYASLTASGGHPDRGIQRAAIRRWIAPDAGEVSIAGEISISMAGSGDGVRARLISSKKGLLAEWILDRVNTASAKTELPGVTVESGEILDFAVDCRDTTTSDGFRWSPSLKRNAAANMDSKTTQTVWDAQSDFRAPPPAKLEALEQMAQALLITNEFLFID